MSAPSMVHCPNSEHHPLLLEAQEKLPGWLTLVPSYEGHFSHLSAWGQIGTVLAWDEQKEGFRILLGPSGSPCDSRHALFPTWTHLSCVLNMNQNSGANTGVLTAARTLSPTPYS